MTRFVGSGVSKALWFADVNRTGARPVIVKQLVLVLTVVLALFAAACGGSGSSFPTPPPPSGTFSNASLKGTYAFSMSGTDASASPGAFIDRTGSFVADGSGGISMALEDVSDAGVLNTVQFSGGSYSIQANGKGTLTLNTLSGTGLVLTIALNSPTKGVMIQTDLNATSSGSFVLQSLSAFSLTAINGAYIFDVSGADVNRAPVSVVGQFMTNGGGAITGGIYDSNDGSSNPPLITAKTFGAGGTYALDPVNSATFGRGTLTFASRTFVFYIVDSTRLRLIETDGQLFTFGDALQQSAAPTQVSAGGFALLLGGSSVLGTKGPIARGGRFTTDVSGNVTSIQLDDNNTGSVTQIGSGNTFTSATFAIDAGNPGTGRGTLQFTASGQANPFTFVFYFDSPTHALIQDTSNGVIADGSMLAQSASFTSANLAGNYVFDWSGINLSLGFEEDFAGQYALSSSGAITGVVDFVELASPSSRNPAFLGIPITGMFSVNGDGTGANNYTVTTGNSPSTTLNYHAYLTASGPVLLVGIDPKRTIAGSATLQP